MECEGETMAKVKVKVKEKEKEGKELKRLNQDPRRLELRRRNEKKRDWEWATERAEGK